MSAKKFSIFILTLFLVAQMSYPVGYSTDLSVSLSPVRVRTPSAEIPTITLVLPANGSSVIEGTIIQGNITGSDLHNVLYAWDDSTTNTTWSPPYITMIPGSAGEHILHVYANNTDDEWSYSRFVFETATYNPVDFAAVWGGFTGAGPNDIAVAPDGSIWVVGGTPSDDYPTQNAFNATLNGPNDAVITKLDSTGSSLEFSTYFGGDWLDTAKGVAIDADGYIFVTGSTSSSYFPTTSGAFLEIPRGDDDVWVAKFAQNGSLLCCTLIGGSSKDFVSGIALDSGGNCYIVGSTRSTDYPLKNAHKTTLGVEQDVFVSIFNPTLSSLVFSTYIGTDEFENGFDIALCPDDTFYVTGVTYSDDFPIINAESYGGGHGAFYDSFLAKFDIDGSGILFSTLYGGSDGEESLPSLAVDDKHGIDKIVRR